MRNFFLGLTLIVFLSVLTGCVVEKGTSSSAEGEIDLLKAQLQETEEMNALLNELEEENTILIAENNFLNEENDRLAEENHQLQLEIEELVQAQIDELKESTGLVEVTEIDEMIIVDLPYATDDNFVSEQVYPVAIALLQEETALKLKKANELAKQDGYRIKLWDGYRPLDVQQTFWELTPDPRYVGDPTTGSNHNRGTAVDVTLVDEAGNELEMPTGFDDFSEKAWRSYGENSAEAQQNMEYLTEIMTESGFTTFNTEWWHYNDSNAKAAPVLNVPLEEFLPER